LKAEFRQDTANFELQLQTADNIIEAVNRGDGAALTAALATMPLLVNPDAGATTDAEVNIWKGVGGLSRKLIGLIDKELGAGGLTDNTRRQIIGTAKQYKRNAITWQQAIESRYGQFLVSEKIPKERWGFFNKTNFVPGLQGTGFIPRDISGPSVKEALSEKLKRAQEENSGRRAGPVESFVERLSTILDDEDDD
jgi:hypothetical protein